MDPMIRVLGKPTRTTSFLRHHGNFADNLFDNCAAVFDYPKAMGVITTSVLQPDATPHRMFEVQGSRGTAILRPIEGPPKLEISLTTAAGPYRKGRNRGHSTSLSALRGRLRRTRPRHPRQPPTHSQRGR